jgi:DNA-directed RNA polymerase subunit M/transcription elongation factor TFIIS
MGFTQAEIKQSPRPYAGGPACPACKLPRQVDADGRPRRCGYCGCNDTGPATLDPKLIHIPQPLRRQCLDCNAVLATHRGSGAAPVRCRVCQHKRRVRLAQESNQRQKEREAKKRAAARKAAEMAERAAKLAARLARQAAKRAAGGRS